MENSGLSTVIYKKCACKSVSTVTYIKCARKSVIGECIE